MKKYLCLLLLLFLAGCASLNVNKKVFEIGHFETCSEIHGHGDYDIKNDFYYYEIISFYLDFRNAVVIDGRIHFEIKMTIYAPNGDIIAEGVVEDKEYVLPMKDVDLLFYIKHLMIPPGVMLGEYIVETSVTDFYSGQTANAKTIFNVKGVRA
jgi:hypothetical protein